MTGAARALVSEQGPAATAEALATALGIGGLQASRLIEDVLHERFAASIAPEPYGPVWAPQAVRERAVALYRHLRAAGRSRLRAERRTAYVFGVSGSTLYQWNRAHDARP